MIAVGATVVLAPGLIAAGPVGWAGLGLLVAAESYMLYKEGNETLRNSYGQTVNKKYVVDTLATCDSNVKSLLDKAYTIQADGTKALKDDDTKKIAITKARLDGFLKEFKDTIPTNDQKDISGKLDAFAEAANKRNQNILAYNNAVVTLFQRLKEKSLHEKQSAQIGSELIKENLGLPSIIAYYQRLRSDSRTAILRTIKQCALALEFWGLLDTGKFASPTLLSTVDEMKSHLGVLLLERQAALSRFSTFAQSMWPMGSHPIGITYELSSDELKALPVEQKDPWVPGARMYTVTIKNLVHAVTRSTSISENPFAGKSNVRLSQVRFWIPGVEAEQKYLSVHLMHGGSEKMVDPDDRSRTFQHYPVHMNFEYDWSSISENEKSVALNPGATYSRQMLASDWMSQNPAIRAQAPVGPFTHWTISMSTSVNGKLDLKGASSAFLEFHGSSFPFKTA